MSVQGLEQEVKEWKSAEVTKLAEIMRNCDVIAVAPLYKVRAAQIQELRRKFRKDISFRCVKNTLFARAVKVLESEKENISDLLKYIQGSNTYIFTNENPFKLSLLFEKSKINLPAKGGDIAPSDIIVREGNTGMSPGPVISEFTELGIPTKIESGSVWISEDTVVTKEGEVISARVASILSKLGMKPMEAGMSLTTAYEKGLVYPPDVLKISMESVKQDILAAVSAAFNLSMAAAYPTSDTIQLILAKAALEAMSLGLSANIFEKETVPIVLAKAYQEAEALKAKLAEKDSSLAS